ncbi:MAG: SCP2 sterol-binding domain-containing protein [Ruminococcus sp.]|jgi:putative sterol carrier protein|nr:SCP2 sterol-binding domain-containing protein [Ruminococcus sp.]HAE52422.1 SCP-2 sterol transfer family protein [Ruminococcus sp.]
MTINELITELRKGAAEKDFSGYDFMAVQVTITGENAGVFYVEIKDGKISIMPYEYIDRQCELIITMDNFIKLVQGKLDPVAAYFSGKLKINGDVGKANEFSKVIK